jgi:thiol-disulfide isomerase/thioredoxin
MTPNKIIALAFLIAVSPISFSQTAPLPEVGKPMPDFALNNMVHYKTANASLKDFKGKWLFLDFWTINCKSCIESFPKINSLQSTFQNEAQFLFVGKNDKYNKGIEKLYERVSKNQNMNVAAAFDSVLFTRWSIRTVPHIYIIDSNGILRFITSRLEKEKIQSLLNGEKVAFKTKDVVRPDFDPGKVFDTGTNVLYSSVLVESKGENSSGFPYDIDLFAKPTFPQEEREKGWKATSLPLYMLYNYAYLGKAFWLFDSPFYGKVYAHPILEVRDSSFFQYPENEGYGKGSYNYYLKVPEGKISDGYIMGEMQRTLESVFGYQVSVEKREMPVWKLVAKPGIEKKLKSKGGEPFHNSKERAVTGFTLRNSHMKTLLRLATTNLPDLKRMITFIDETGITYNIDFTMMDTDMTSYDSVRKGLIAYGLDLVKGKKEMKVIVIRDAERKVDIRQ